MLKPSEELKNLPVCFDASQFRKKLSMQHKHPEKQGAASYLVECDYIVDQKDRHGLTSLMQAAHYGCVDSAKLLIARGANVNARVNNDGRTPLHFASSHNHDRGTQIARLLIEAGAGVDHPDEFEWTPLMIATEAENVELQQLLISKGADAGACKRMKRYLK